MVADRIEYGAVFRGSIRASLGVWCVAAAAHVSSHDALAVDSDTLEIRFRGHFLVKIDLWSPETYSSSAYASISTMQRGSAKAVTPTVVDAGTASPKKLKYSWCPSRL